ncbi:hypothetical protein AB1N83_013949 [Pleurotus pulmonarius]
MRTRAGALGAWIRLGGECVRSQNHRRRRETMCCLGACDGLGNVSTNGLRRGNGDSCLTTMLTCCLRFSTVLATRRHFADSFSLWLVAATESAASRPLAPTPTAPTQQRRLHQQP